MILDSKNAQLRGGRHGTLVAVAQNVRDYPSNDLRDLDMLRELERSELRKLEDAMRTRIRRSTATKPVR